MVDKNSQTHIDEMFNREIPYEKNILGCKFIVDSHDSYPPGKLTEMFLAFLINNNLIQDKIIADIGAGSFALGIVAAKNGAKLALGTEIVKDAYISAQNNIKNNDVNDKAFIFLGNSVDPLLSDYQDKIDILVSGLPWNSIALEEFNKIPKEKRNLAKSFYDIEDNFITDLLTKGFLLLNEHGRIYITSSLNVIERTKIICAKNNVNYEIVEEQDLHNDGNIHFILRLNNKIYLNK